MILKSTPHILVCVTDPADSHRLIAAGRTIADEHDLPLKVICVLPHHAGKKHAEIMQKLYNICVKHQAELTVLFHENPALTIAIAAQKAGAAHLLCGTPIVAGPDFIAFIREMLPNVPLSVVNADDTVITFPPLAVQTVS